MNREPDFVSLFLLFLGGWMAGNGTNLVVNQFSEPLPDPLLTGGTLILCGLFIYGSEYWIWKQGEDYNE